MKLEKVPRIKAPPPEEHAIGIYIGLILGGLVLGIGAVVLFKDILITFASEGIKLTDITLFRALLFLASSLASLACFFAFFKLVFLQRAQVKKVDDKFKDFTMYARPLIEEVIHQRIISEHLLERLDESSKNGRGMEDASKLKYDVKPISFREYSKRGEFLVFIAILSSMTMGLFVYLERHPWGLVPYSVIFLAVAWWFIIAKYFDLVYDIRSYYVPTVFILLMPSLSIVLRAFMMPYQAVYTVFAVMSFYVWLMYTYFNYLDTGAAPRLFSVISAKSMELPFSRRFKKFAGRQTLSPRAMELFPPKEYKGPPGKERGPASQRINVLFPTKKNNKISLKKERTGKLHQGLSDLRKKLTEKSKKG